MKHFFFIDIIISRKSGYRLSIISSRHTHSDWFVSDWKLKVDFVRYKNVKWKSHSCYKVEDKFNIFDIFLCNFINNLFAVSKLNKNSNLSVEDNLIYSVDHRSNPLTHLLISPWPQNAHAIHRGDRWRQVSADALDVDVELPALHTLNDRDPNDAYDDHETHKRPMSRNEKK